MTMVNSGLRGLNVYYTVTFDMLTYLCTDIMVMYYFSLTFSVMESNDEVASS